MSVQFKFDPTQWRLVSNGDQIQRIKNLVCGLEWDVETENLDKFCKFLDKEHVLTVQNGQCTCDTSCGSKFGFEELLRFRHNGIGDLAHVIERCGVLLQTPNTQARHLFQTTGKSSQIRYVIGTVVVCSTFYQLALGHSHHTCLKIRKAALGDETWKFPSPRQVKDSLPRYVTSENKTSVCDSFWAYFSRHSHPRLQKECSCGLETCHAS